MKLVFLSSINVLNITHHKLHLHIIATPPKFCCILFYFLKWTPSPLNKRRPSSTGLPVVLKASGGNPWSLLECLTWDMVAGRFSSNLFISCKPIPFSWSDIFFIIFSLAVLLESLFEDSCWIYSCCSKDWYAPCAGLVCPLAITGLVGFWPVYLLLQCTTSLVVVLVGPLYTGPVHKIDHFDI